MSIRELEPDLVGRGICVGVVQTRFNQDIGEGLRSGCLEELNRHGVVDADITHTTMPGAQELPLAGQAMAQSGRFNALLALGAVICSETYHVEIFSNKSARGIIDVQLNNGIPIANAALTTENDYQAPVRMVQKGAEAARATVESANRIKVVTHRSEAC